MLAQAQNEWTVAEAAHLMRRAAFGGAPADIRRVHALGRESAVEALLAPDEPLDAMPRPSWADQEVAETERRELAAENRKFRRDQRGMSDEEMASARQARQRSRQRDYRQRLAESSRWWFKRMMRTRAPLREKMVLFWHDHFATSARKVKQPLLMLEQNDLFRKHATGSFKELTHAILMDPAMMLYLDTQTSKKAKPNENFAREVMELFTLGEGHYTEADIKEAARAFTGYTVNRLNGKSAHQKFQWDSGKKTVLGKSGNFDGDDVIEVLFEQQAASEYLPSKLWRFFVEDEPPKVIVKKLGESFRKSGFQLEPLLREIFLSRAFYDSTVIRNQIKSPVQFLIQMCKELEIEELPAGYAAVAQQQLGQVLFAPPNVAGWDWGRAWINTNTLLSRYNISGVISKGSAPAGDTGGGDGGMMEMAEASGRRMAGRMLRRSMQHWNGPDYEEIAPRSLREDPDKLVAALMDRLFQTELPPKHRRTFEAYAVEKKGAIFTNHEVAELCHLMMSTPHYQLA